MTTNTATDQYIIEQEKFDLYSADWQTAALAGGTELTHAFHASDGMLMTSVSFPLERIKWLVSAVGVRQIKARFLLMPSSSTPRFTVVLFATDEQGERLSAYYLPTPYQPTGSTPPIVGAAIPGDLAADWRDNWTNTDEITPAMFATRTTPLQGYNFKVKDFVTTLFNCQPFKEQNIYLGFGLHQFHGPTNLEGTLTQTFGLVLQLAAMAQAVAGPQEESYFDMAAPCPPNT